MGYRLSIPTSTPQITSVSANSSTSFVFDVDGGFESSRGNRFDRGCFQSPSDVCFAVFPRLPRLLERSQRTELTLPVTRVVIPGIISISGSSEIGSFSAS